MAEVYDGAVDRGLEGVVACTTRISSIVDATLCYRGYTIEDLAANSTFEEVVFLLWNNRLPKADELSSFAKELSSGMDLKPETVKILSKFPTKDVHPMAWLRSAVSTLSLWDDGAQATDRGTQNKVAMSLTGRMGSLVALFQRLRDGKEYVAPKAGKTMAWNFLYMLKGEEPDAEMVKVFDTCLILHADHELNCSAFTSRVVASSLSDIYSAITAGIGALKGPLHGGANEQVMKTLKKIGSTDKAQEWVNTALANKEKIMGFGHRVYRNGDPRAKILKGMSKSLAEKTGNGKYYEMSDILETTVKNEKGLLPNVDFYSATVYFNMGIPLDLYTPIFATSRVSGWLAHVFEQYDQNRIYRPRGQWEGKEGLKWLPASDR